MIYSGLGPLALVVYLVVVFAADELAKQFGITMHLFKDPAASIAVFAIAGVITFIVGKLINRRPLEVVELHQEGEVVVKKPRHTIYYLPMEYWGGIFFVLFSLILFTPHK